MEVLGSANPIKEDLLWHPLQNNSLWKYATYFHVLFMYFAYNRISKLSQLCLQSQPNSQ